MPAPIGVPEGLRFPGTGEGLLIEGVGDYLAQGMRHCPVLQHPLNVEVELTLDTLTYGILISAWRFLRSA
jgi:hypothetical protein